jgi:CO dehydrogenase maturation factor
MSEVNRVLNGTRIGVFGKGGCGKSTVTVLLAKALRAKGYEVAVLDADSTNLGLPDALGVERAPQPLVDYFGGMVFSGGAVTCPVDDPTPLKGASFQIDAIPDMYVGCTEDGIRFLTAGKIGELGPGAGCDGPITKIARDLRLRRAGVDPVTVTDFKAGLEDSARGAVIGLDWALVVVDPTTAAIQMAVHVKKMVEQLRSGARPATAHLDSPDLVVLANRIFLSARVKGIVVVLNKIVDAETERYLRERLGGEGIRPSGVLYDDPTTRLAWLKGEPLPWLNHRAEAEGLVAAVEETETPAPAATV